MSELDIYFRVRLLERRLCLLEAKEKLEESCSIIDIVDFIEDIDLVNKPCNRFIVVLIDSTNNGDMSLYMNLKGTLKFLQTIA